jgi:hypothetical protein
MKTKINNLFVLWAVKDPSYYTKSQTTQTEISNNAPEGPSHPA